jgi:hypothetical protein
MEQTNTVRNWSIIGALVVLVGLLAWFYSGNTGTAPSLGVTDDAVQTAPAADAATDGMAAEPAPADGTAAPADGTAAPADGTAAPATDGTNP